MKLRDLYRDGCEKLNKTGIEEAELDSRLLLLSAFSISMAEYLLYDNRDLTEIKSVKSVSDSVELYNRYIAERMQRRPVQYILGETEFMGICMSCSEGVLIPRQDTEVLCEEVLSANRNPELSVLDMCTGSGCIAAALSYYGGYKDITAADISDRAIEIAEANLRAHVKNGYRLVKTDLFTEFKDEAGRPAVKFDIIVSNPPYICSAEIEGLEPEVKDYEPRLALDGTEDGLYFYRKISDEARLFLNDGGRLYYEIGYDQGEALRELLSELGYSDIKVIKDLSGLDRVVSASFL